VTQRLDSFQGTIANNIPPKYSLIGFGYDPMPVVPLIRVPYWFPVVLSLVVAVAPWLRWSRRFSLRTLLIATTLVAVVLGLIVAVLRWPAD
jgi:hypothetical protein